MNDYAPGWFALFEVMANGTLLLVSVGTYLLVSFATLAIFRKTGSDDWKAWVPFVREWEMFRLAGMSPGWAVILPVGSIAVTFFGFLIMIVAVSSVIGFGTRENIGESLALGFGGVAVFLLIMLGWGVFSLIVWIKMMNRINEGFDQPLALTILGVVLYPAWLAVLGWGSARWHSAPQGSTNHLRFPDGSLVDLRGNRVVIGSSPLSDGLPARTQLVSVRDATGTVAPFHAQLDRVGETWMLSDLQSATGTFVIDEHDQAFRVVQPVTGARSFMLGRVRVDLGS